MTKLDLWLAIITTCTPTNACGGQPKTTASGIGQTLRMPSSTRPCAQRFGKSGSTAITLRYAALSGRTDLTVATWEPSNTMRLYIRKDLAAQLWEFGAAPQPDEAVKEDPYKAGTINLEPVKAVANLNDKPFNAPRGLAVAADGSFFVADSRNNLIVHFDKDGMFLNSWGSPSGKMDINSPDGTFNEPWGVAVGADGKVYVADTWNHRIQVFNPDGSFVTKWGSFTVNGQVDGFWGPRGIAIDQSNHVYVTDTGKQRVVVFDSNGNYLTQFGSRGLDLGPIG